MSSLLLAFGSNLGDRALHIRRALQELDGRVGTLVKASSMIETEPEGFESVHSFLNSAALFETELEPLEILRITQEVERMEGRKHKSVNGSYSDRPLDIDMIALDSLLWNSEELTLPHPEVTERSFVLQPLAEIVPNFVHPGTGATYAALFYRIGGRKVRHAGKRRRIRRNV